MLTAMLVLRHTQGLVHLSIELVLGRGFTLPAFLRLQSLFNCLPVLCGSQDSVSVHATLLQTFEGPL